ncbi:hypothetical protein CHLRE_02g110900v5 [Chlamydomonas reinhardtii]|uniref:Uncharacterized protein n=1 Tax=Chlamydomonas reinhardtii TaxID=3055 RepID=A0A2K3E2Z0_CHLRE|nr:uncharacterized protein CHLRE_02g110900v5 [Chlamydomonas reinhardtii]PNW87146.1 hypothetical protein CHLRE_02g110900v5 [Chlamydomonas reinhardtii]
MLSIATAQHPGAGVAAASAAVVPTEVGVSGGGMSSVFRSRDRQKTPRRQPIWLKRDKFMRHGELLLSAALSAVISPAPASEPPGPAEAAGAASSGGPGGRGEDDTAGVAQALERCLAVVRFAVGMLADMLRPGGPDSDDLPVTALGQHHVTVRQLLAAARTQQQHPMATSGTGRTLPVPAPRVHVQELLSFDPAEGPKSLAVIEPAAVAGAGDGTSGLLLLERLAAVARVRIDPRVSAKAKRLGREVSLKVKLDGGGEVVLLRPLPPFQHGGTASSPPDAARAGPGGAAPVSPGSGAGGAGHSGVSVVMPPPAGLARPSPLVDLLPPTTLIAASISSGAPAEAAPAQPAEHAPGDGGAVAERQPQQPPPNQQLPPPPPPAPQPALQQAPAAEQHRHPEPQQAQERYLISSLPSLVLRGRLPHAAEPEFKGDLVVHSPDTGMMVSITFGEGGAAKGVVEMQPPQPQLPAGSSSSASFSAGSSPARQAAGGTPVGRRQQQSRFAGVLGRVSGSLHDSIQVTCPALALEGDIHSEQPPAPGLPPLAPALDLAAPGPQQLPRLWSALHDAFLYADPAQASGGKAAEQLTHQLAGMLHSLFPGSRSSSRSGGAGGSSSAAAGPVAMARSAQGTRAGRSVAGAAGKESIVGASSSAAAASTAAAANPDDSDADSDFEAAAARDAGDTAEDPRDVPPNYKAKHAAGQRLGWQLQYTLVLPDASAAPAAANSATGAAGGTVSRLPHPMHLVPSSLAAAAGAAAQGGQARLR